MTRTELEKKLQKLVTGIQVSTYYADNEEIALQNQAAMHLKDLLKIFDSFLEDLEIQHAKELEECEVESRKHELLNIPFNDGRWTLAEIKEHWKKRINNLEAELNKLKGSK